MRWDYASCYGHPFINTRHLDHVAKMGTRFEYAFAAAPACGPSRASFMTGQYPNEHGVRNYGGELDPAHPSYLSVLKQAGYVRGLFGKDHVFADGGTIGVNYEEGWDICLGLMDAHPAYNRAWDCAKLEPDSEWNITAKLADLAIDFIERKASGSEPFFATVNFQDPHPFFACPDPWASLFQAEEFHLPGNYRTRSVPKEPRRLSHWRIHSGEVDMPEVELRRAMAMYCGQIRYVDDQIGRIVEKLDSLNLLSNTIILIWSDHGEFIGDYGVTHKLPSFYECLMRIPLVLWDPTGRIPTGVNSNLIEAMDVVASVLDLCGLPQSSGSRARSILRNESGRPDVFAEAGLLVQQPSNPIPGMRIKGAHPPSSFGAGAMLRTKKWKLCTYADDQNELFDLTVDPLERQNLYGDAACISIQNEMHERLNRRLMCKGQAPEDLEIRTPWATH
jgi:arylsulfatase A-like enzyme